MSRYEINIPSVEKLNRPFKANFGRINVILGSNGTGKSKVLQSLKSNHTMFDGRSDVVYVEGGRTFTIPASLAVSRQTVEYATLEQASMSHKKKRSENLSQRITDALFALDRMGEAEYRRHSDLSEQWAKSDRKEPIPLRSDPPLEQLCKIFSSVFPEILLNIDSGSKKITCKKNASAPYAPAGLSDGEKQVFCLIADILLLSHGNPLIIVDEPELNLHPSLAIDLWNLIESTLPDAVFIYATHSVAFALKHNVDSLIVLPRTGLDPIAVKDFSEINSEDLRSFLGAIPAILANSKAIAVEGEKESLDGIIYKWIIGDKAVAIEAVGSCNSVASAIKREGVWKTLGDTQKLVGIIDRDFRLDRILKKFEDEGVFILPFHEIESILSLPKVVKLLSERLALVEPTTEEIVKQKIIARWNDQYIEVAVKRTFYALERKFAPSLSKKEIADIRDSQERLELAVIECCASEISRLSSETESDKVKASFQEILQQCKKALDDKDIPAILNLMPGKLMVQDVLQWTGCRNIESAARAIANHIRVEEIDELVSLRAELWKRLDFVI